MTLCTVGYGDAYPVHPVVWSLAVAEALVGQLYLAIRIASLVGMALQATSVRESPEAALLSHSAASVRDEEGNSPTPVTISGRRWLASSPESVRGALLSERCCLCTYEFPER